MNGFVGFFVRDQLGQTPTQTGTSWSTSPDIVLAGASPPNDPSQYVSTAGYATDYGSNIYASQPPTPNYVYLRALNTNAGAATGRAWFYWVESDLALWPQNWNSYLILVAGQQINYQDIVATANNQVCMANLPFIWSPPPPSSGNHFCVINWMEYPPSTQNPPPSPVLAIGALPTFNDLVNFVLQHQNMGWRNTTNVGGLGFTWTQTANVTGPSTSPGMFYLGIQCTNMPTDGQLGYQIPGPTPNIAPIISNLTPISNPNMLNLVPITGWPAGAKSSITINFKQGPTQPPLGAGVTVTLVIPKTSLEEDTLTLLAAAPEHMRFHAKADQLRHRTDLMAVEDDIFGAVLGTMTYGF